MKRALLRILAALTLAGALVAVGCKSEGGEGGGSGEAAAEGGVNESAEGEGEGAEGESAEGESAEGGPTTRPADGE